MKRRQTTEEWVTQCVNDTIKGTCRALAVVHYAGGQPNEIDKIPLTGELTPKEIATRFDERLYQYVHDMPGMQSCEMLAFYASAGSDGTLRESSEPENRRPMMVSGSSSYPGLTTEPPTPTGFVQQTMRHSEIFAQTLAQAQTQLMQGFIQLNARAIEHVDRLAMECEKLREENTDAWTIVRENALSIAKEQNELAIARFKEEKNAAMLAKLLQWAPALVNTITGKKVFPEATEDSAIVQGLLENMQPAHIGMLTGLLPPEVAGIVSARANEIFARREKALSVSAEANGLTRGLDPVGELQ